MKVDVTKGGTVLLEKKSGEYLQTTVEDIKKALALTSGNPFREANVLNVLNNMRKEPDDSQKFYIMADMLKHSGGYANRGFIQNL